MQWLKIKIQTFDRSAPRGDQHKITSDDDLTFALIAVTRWRHKQRLKYPWNWLECQLKETLADNNLLGSKKFEGLQVQNLHHWLQRRRSRDSEDMRKKVCTQQNTLIVLVSATNTGVTPGLLWRLKTSLKRSSRFWGKTVKEVDGENQASLNASSRRRFWRCLASRVTLRVTL